MKEYLTQNQIAAIIFVAFVVAAAIVLLVKIMQTVGMEKVRKCVYKAFIYAEKEFKHGQNQEKFNYVVRVAKDTVPMPFSLFITETFLRNVIQTWFDLCKDLLDDGRLNGSKQEG